MMEWFARRAVRSAVAGGLCLTLALTVSAQDLAQFEKDLTEFTLDNGRGLEVKVMTYGATLTSVVFPDRAGKRANLTLHLDSLDDYLQGHPLFGSVVGRFANRIEGAAFDIDGVTYDVTQNAGRNHIHGGALGFQKLIIRAGCRR